MNYFQKLKLYLRWILSMKWVFSGFKRAIIKISVFLIIAIIVDYMVSFPSFISLEKNDYIENITFRTFGRSRIAHKESWLRLTVNHDRGRLGNKLFRYASLLGIANATGRQAFVGPYTAHLKLEDVFYLSHVVSDRSPDVNSWTVVNETKYAMFDPVFQKLPPQDIMIRACLQSWKYFFNVQDQIRREFNFRPHIREKVTKIHNQIREAIGTDGKVVFIGVHVRRPDEYSKNNTSVAPKSFFLKAFQKMKSLLPNDNLVFLVSGNDLTWCHENLQGNDVVILKPAAAEIHFAVLASSDHVIISIGTYGWWAGWLANGHVIFYKKFPHPNSYEYKGFVYEDYYPPHWIPGDD